MASTRELKGRINSVHSSQKITGAMKMISYARLRKSENALNHDRPYMEQLQNIVDHIPMIAEENGGCAAPQSCSPRNCFSCTRPSPLVVPG